MKQLLSAIGLALLAPLAPLALAQGVPAAAEIGRASCRERV